MSIMKIGNEQTKQLNTIKGWLIDDERLKNCGSILTEKYFEEQLNYMKKWNLKKIDEIQTHYIMTKSKNQQKIARLGRKKEFNG